MAGITVTDGSPTCMQPHNELGTTPPRLVAEILSLETSGTRGCLESPLRHPT